MATLANLVVQLTADVSGFASAMADAEKRAKMTAADVGKSLSAMGDKMSNIGAGLTAGVTLPIAAAGAAAVMAASDTEEAWNKVAVVFGDNAEAVKDWAGDSAESFGLSQAQAYTAIGTFGNLFDAMGIGEDATLDMSTSLVGLAADLASFNNIDPTEALEKLRAGLVGETEPLRSLGVNLDAATIKAKALEMGLISNGQQLTAAARAQAAYAIIMEQTSNAQGDFARTSDSVANQMRIVKAELANVASEFGTQLLPVAKQALTVLSQMLKFFSSLPEPVQQGIIAMLALAAAVGPLLMVIGNVISAVGTLTTLFGAGGALAGVGTAIAGAMATAGAAIASFLAAAAPVILVVGAIIAVIAVLYVAWTQNWGGIQEKFAAFASWYQSTATALWSGALNFLRSIWEQIKAVFAAAVQFLQPLIKAFLAAMQGDWYAFGANLRAWIDQLWNTLKSIFTAGVRAVIGIFTGTNWGAIGSAIVQGIANAINNGVGAIINAARNAARAALNAAKGFLGVKSPSKAFMWLGDMTIAGFVKGLDPAPVVAAMSGLTNAMSAPVYGAAGAVGLPAPVENRNVTVNVYNPTPENAGGSVSRELQKLSYLGAV